MSQEIDCTNTTVTLDGSESSQAANITYNWTTVDGSILSDGNTAMPTVSSAGTYTLTVTNSTTGCTATDVVIVTQDMQMPILSITSSNLLDCTNSTVTLIGSSEGDENLSFLWTTIDGTIVSIGNDPAEIVVNAGGTYTLTATNTMNNCSAIITTIVEDNSILPAVNAGESTLLTCSTTSLVLTGTGDANPDVTYIWTTTDGNIVNGATTLTPTIDAEGTYILTGTNTVTGCTASTQVQILSDTDLPTANAGSNQLLNLSLIHISEPTRPY